MKFYIEYNTFQYNAIQHYIEVHDLVQHYFAFSDSLLVSIMLKSILPFVTRCMELLNAIGRYVAENGCV